jgi:uroporphyrinogen decarboxylase
VEAIFFMDDWGAQNSLLISPDAWRELFKPLYADYCKIAHDAGKYVFMHSDGCIFDIYEDLIEIGVDAINSQLFTMDIEEIGKRFKGRITFWGEIDRQHILPSPDVEVARRAVRRVADALYDGHGGVVAQFEFGVAARIENAYAIFEEWEKVASPSI